MKYIFFLLSVLFLNTNCAAQKYSTSNKKAIKLFEMGRKAPSESIDPETHLPNFKAGIEYMNKAIEKDPSFWEAHMFAGEFCETIGDYENAIMHYQAAIRINPEHNRTGSTYFYLASLQYATGDYENAIRNLNIFERIPDANPQLLQQGVMIRESCTFAIEAIKNPTNFNPINIGPGINTADPEYFPTITVDGKTILFTRRIADGRVEGPYKEQEDFFVSQLSNDNVWEKSVPMPDNVNSVNNEGAPTIAPDGRTLVFVACPDVSGYYGDEREGRGSCDLFVTKKLGARWTNPVNLPGNVNTFSWESQPSLSSDGRTMYFIRRVSKKGDPQNADIFVSHLGEDGKWQPAQRLPDYINTPYNEESVLIHPDGRTLYFASRGHIGMGGYDLYLCRMDENGVWSKPENLGYPINTLFDENSLMVSPDGEIAFFASDREGGFGDLDIYYFEMPEHIRPTKTLYFEGIVYDVETNNPIPGKFQLIDLKTGKEIIYSEADKVSGEFMVSLPVNRSYALNVTYPGYTFFSENFDMTNPDGLEAIHMDVPMVPLSSSKTTVLANVFFDLNKATLRPESYVELNKLVDFLNENGNIKIEIGGHTDSRGTNNQVLSEERAKAVFDYVVSKGIDPKRMIHKGYGSSKPVFSDEKIATLASDTEKEAAHQANRRTEYKIISE